MKYLSILLFCIMLTIVAPNITFAKDQKRISEIDKELEALNKRISILQQERKTLTGKDKSYPNWQLPPRSSPKK